MLLDDSTPKDRREVIVRGSVPRAAEVIRAMVADLRADDSKEEYRRIPWIWRVAFAAGRANDAKVVGELLDLSLPSKGQPLRDWQAVVLGGGVINGLSLEGVWPAKRLAELIRGNAELEARWLETLKQSHEMADSEKVSTGTRYDALRIVALDSWKAAEPRLAKYLSKSANAELQQGAISGLVDIDDPKATVLLVNALTELSTGNRKLTIAGLLRTTARAEALLDALEKAKAKPEWLGMDHRDALLKHPQDSIRARAAKLFVGQ